MAASTIAARALPPAGDGLAGLGQVARALRQWMAWPRRERRMRTRSGDMRALDDRLLADLGLTRGHIAYAEHASRHGRLAKGWNCGLCR